MAHELSPGLTVQLDREHVVGLVSEEGTRTAHAAILAHSLGIPAVMGAVGALARILDGAMLCWTDRAASSSSSRRWTSWTTPRPRSAAGTGSSSSSKGSWTSRRSPLGPAHPAAGQRGPAGGDRAAQRLGAQGVGLLRTEFLLTGRATLPTENEQAEYFRRVALAFPGQTIVIRSFDLGGDKFPVAFKSSPEANRFSAGDPSGCAWTSRRCSARRSARSSALQWGGTSSSCCPW